MGENHVKLVPAETSFRVRAGCPYCGGTLQVKPVEWEKVEDTPHHICTQIEVDCATMPDVGSGKWENFFLTHTDDMYTLWHPMTERLLEKIKKNYRFYQV